MNNKIYFLSRWYKKIFPGPVRKVPLDIGTTCPGRDGTIGTKGCLYCNVPAFSPFMKGTNQRTRGSIYSSQKVINDFETASAKLSRRGKFKKFLPYLNAFTPSHCKISEFEKIARPLAFHPISAGLAITTRPDSVGPEFIELFAHISSRTYMALELGLQSCKNQTLLAMNRGHSAEDFEKCARQIKKDCPEIDLSAHLILGFPGETAQDWLDSALFAIASGAQGLKFHHLHAFPGTPLYDMTLKNQIILPQLDDYVEKIIFLLERIPATTVIHRLSASSMQEVLPLWTMEAQKTRHLILKKMEEKNTFQGKFYFPLNPGP